jgi:hypothetical protein
MKKCLLLILAIVMTAVGMQVAFMPSNTGELALAASQESAALNDAIFEADSMSEIVDVLPVNDDRSLSFSRKKMPAIKPTQTRVAKKNNRTFKKAAEIRTIISTEVINPLTAMNKRSARFSRIMVMPKKYTYELFSRKEGLSKCEFEVSYQNDFLLKDKSGKVIPPKAQVFLKGYVDALTGECYIYQKKGKSQVAVKANTVYKKVKI